MGNGTTDMISDDRPLGTSQGSMGRPFKILVVDDSALQRRILRVMLTKRGYEVSEAECGATALRMCAADSPDIILSDWMILDSFYQSCPIR